MNPPKVVKMGGQSWSVEVLSFDSELNLYGRTQAKHARIQLERDQAQVQMRDTLLHELMHAAFSNVPINMTNEDEEATIRALTPWLLAALRDNPRLVSFLLEK